MKCESCNIRVFEVEEPGDGGSNPFRLCVHCRDRLLIRALRPLEFFNLTAIHGHCYYLHDDFYDYDSGIATQPEINVIDADKFPFPVFQDIKDDLYKLIDYSFVQYFTSDIVIEQLKKFDKLQVLNRINEKIKYNRAVNYKAYEMVGKVISNVAENWIKKEWEERLENEIYIFAEALVSCLEFEEAFQLLTNEIENSDDKTFNEHISALLYFRSEIVLDWIETKTDRIKNISSSWGQLAASSQFSWQRAEKWLSIGRPLSLISLDALYLCTTKDYLGQSLWLRKIQPKLTDSVHPDFIAKRLQEFLEVDKVPRTKNSVGTIMYNLFQSNDKRSPNH